MIIYRRRRSAIVSIIIAVIILAISLFLGITIYRSVERGKRISSAIHGGVGTFQANLKVDTGKLTEEQQKAMEVFCSLSGIDEGDLADLVLDGSYDADTTNIIVYTSKQVKVTELVLEDGKLSVDVETMYDLMQANLSEKSSILSALIPDWSPDADSYQTFSTEWTEVITDQLEDVVPENNVVTSVGSHLDLLACTLAPYMADSHYGDTYVYHLNAAQDYRIKLLLKRFLSVPFIGDQPVDLTVTLGEETMTVYFDATLQDAGILDSIDGTLTFPFPEEDGK